MNLFLLQKSLLLNFFWSIGPQGRDHWYPFWTFELPWVSKLSQKEFCFPINQNNWYLSKTYLSPISQDGSSIWMTDRNSKSAAMDFTGIMKNYNRLHHLVLLILVFIPVNNTTLNYFWISTHQFSPRLSQKRISFALTLKRFKHKIPTLMHHKYRILLFRRLTSYAHKSQLNKREHFCNESCFRKQ